jgi:ketosteroid isomerase-like protein
MTKPFMFVLAALAAGTPAVADSDWQPIFDGRSLSGWEQVGPGKFVLEDGLLKTQGGMGMLWFTPRKIGNATIRVVYKTASKEANSGVFIRIPEKPTEPWMPVNRGYEVQIDDAVDDSHVTGVLYSLTKAMARAGKPGEWNEMEITLDGPRTIVSVNGARVTDYVEGQPVPPKARTYEPDRGPRPMEGYIGLQNHSDKDVVWFKEVSVRPLALAAGPSAASSAVGRLDEERTDAMVKGDLATLDRLLGDDLSYVHSSTKVDTKASFIENLRSGASKYKGFQREESSTRLFGDSAVNTGVAVVSVENQGQAPATFKIRYTDVWVNRGGQWQMVAWQSTRLP